MAGYNRSSLMLNHGHITNFQDVDVEIPPSRTCAMTACGGIEDFNLSEVEIWKIANNTGVPPSLQKRDSASHLVELHKKYHGGPPFSRKFYAYPMMDMT